MVVSLMRKIALMCGKALAPVLDNNDIKSHYMLLLALFLLKPVTWYIALKSGIIENRNTMLLWAAGITVVLTRVDKVSVANRLPVSA
jgi:hypothetical protein